MRAFSHAPAPTNPAPACSGGVGNHIAPRYRHAVVLDVGGTKLRAVSWTRRGALLTEVSEPTPDESDAEAITARSTGAGRRAVYDLSVGDRVLPNVSEGVHHLGKASVVMGDLRAELDSLPDGHGGARVVADVNQIDDARIALASTGAHVIPAAVVWQRLHSDHAQWARLAAHWEELRPDKYAAESGTHRMRRYGRFVLARDGARRLLPHAAFRQPTNTNRLFPDAGRDLDPLTDAFVADPILDALLPLLSGIAAGIEDAPQWTVHVHLFRVVGSTDSLGDATPEGRHQDGVTLVSSLLVGRRNVAGGQSSVFDPHGREVLTTTLSEPGTLLVGDDRRTWHSVSPIRPVDRDAPAFRDVLVVTLAPC
jgi:hypothetical protein